MLSPNRARAGCTVALNAAAVYIRPRVAASIASCAIKPPRLLVLSMYAVADISVFLSFLGNRVSSAMLVLHGLTQIVTPSVVIHDHRW